MSETTIVPRDRITAFETSMQKAVLEADRLGLTLAQCFEPGRFSAKQTVLGRGWLLFVRATDGWCWGLVRAVDDRGHLVMEREGRPHADPVPDAGDPKRQEVLDRMAKARAARMTRNAA